MRAWHNTRTKAKVISTAVSQEYNLKLFFKMFMALTLLCLLTACGKSQPTSFYILESKTVSSTFSYTAKSKRKMPKIILQEVKIPGYLDRDAVILRQNEGVEVQISEFNAWAEDLDGGIRRILADVFLDSLLKQNVLLIPMDDDTANASKLFVFIQRFDGQLNGNVTLDVRWALHSDNDDALAAGSFSEQAPAGATYASLVAAQSALLVQFAEHISIPIAEATRSK